MKMKRIGAGIAALLMLTAFCTGCGEKSESKTPHTTYSQEEIEGMSDEELEKVLEKAASEIEAAENAQEETEAASTELEVINIWDDVEINYYGVENDGVVYDIEYVGDNQVIKDNVLFYPGKVKPDDYGVLREPDYYSTLPNHFFSSFSTFNGDEITIGARYDKDILTQAGIAIEEHNYTVTLENLCTPADVDDNTDISIYKEAVEFLTEQITAEDGPFEWAANKEIHPYKYGVTKTSDGFTNQLFVFYHDNEDNYVGGIEFFSVNYVDANGDWYKEYFEERYLRKKKQGNDLSVVMYETMSDKPAFIMITYDLE